MLNIIDCHTHLNQVDGTLQDNIYDYFEKAKKENLYVDKAVACIEANQILGLFKDEKLLEINSDFNLKDIHPKLTTEIIPYFYVPYNSSNRAPPKWMKDIDCSEYITGLKNAGFKGLKFRCIDGFNQNIYNIFKEGIDKGMSIQAHINAPDRILETLETGEFPLSRIIDETTQSGNIFYGVHSSDIMLNLIENMDLNEFEFEKYTKLKKVIENNLKNIYLGSSDALEGHTTEYLYHTNTKYISYSTKLKQLQDDKSEILKHICFESDIFRGHITFDNHMPIINSTTLRNKDKNNILYNNGKDYASKIA
ncbi:MAG: hypothetical protein K0B07_03385 [DPANN group archaeon]|nr:hypothetical protein [DPANN group archaeon]